MPVAATAKILEAKASAKRHVQHYQQHKDFEHGLDIVALLGVPKLCSLKVELGAILPRNIIVNIVALILWLTLGLVSLRRIVVIVIICRRGRWWWRCCGRTF